MRHLSKQDSIREGIVDSLAEVVRSVILLLGGWTLADIPAMLEQAGTRESSKGCGDSDGNEDDPVWEPRPCGREIELEEKEEDLWPKWVRRARRRVSILLGALIELSHKVSTRDVVVIFGRDMYPVQAILPVWERHLRGTWIYVEGASRVVIENDRLRKVVAQAVMKHLKPGSRVWGVDTGFEGSVPSLLLWYNPHIDWKSPEEYAVAMVSANAPWNRIYSRIDEENGWEESLAREEVLKLEHYPKPFMRATEVNDLGLPKMRMSRRKDILRAAAMMVAAEEEAKRVLEEMPSLFKLDGDTAYDRLVLRQQKEGEAWFSVHAMPF